MKPARILTLLFLFAAFTAAAQGGRDAIEEQKRVIAALEKRIADEERAISKIQEGRAATEERVRRLARQLDSRNQLLEETEKQVRLLRKEISRTDSVAGDLSSALERNRTQYAEMVREAYRNYKHNNYLTYIFSSRDFADVAKKITNLREVEIVTGLPVIGPDGDDIQQIVRLFEQFRHLSAKNSCGSAVIRSSFLRKIELLYNRAAARRKELYSLLDMPLGRRASLYIATHSTAELTAASVAEAVSSDADETALNHALLIATGLNFSQYVNRVRLILAMSYFLYDSLPFDYVSSISGFHMSITFFRRFKALTGMTPQGYLTDILSAGKDGRVYRGMIMSETLISAISYLYENMSEPIDAEKIARDLYTSENILRVQLKTRLNSSYKQILSMFRVRYAEALLTTTELPTVDIAMETGFGSDRTMGRVFYALNKMSPGEFRKQRGQGRKQHG